MFRNGRHAYLDADALWLTLSLALLIGLLFVAVLEAWRWFNRRLLRRSLSESLDRWRRAHR